MKIRLYLPLNKILKLYNLTIIARSVFQEDKYFFRQMFVWVIKMLQYERTDIPEGIDINKIGKSKECNLPLLVL